MTGKKGMGHERVHGDTCTVPGCDRPYMSKGLCSMHYERKRKGYAMEAPPMVSGSVVDAFIERLFSEPQDECVIWPWARATMSGYAYRINPNGSNSVSRDLCRRHNGEPPTPEHQAAPTCERGREGCVNPKHLVWETGAENMARRRGKKMPQLRPPLTEDEVIAVLQAYSGGESTVSIARRMGVSYSRVYSICLKKTQVRPSFTRANALLTQLRSANR